MGAEFSGAPRQGLVPLTVNFTDESTGATGDITSWEWDFGDGGTSTGQNPTHTYQALGSYSVSLTVMAVDVVSTADKADYIGVFELLGQRFSEVPIEVLRERIQWGGSIGTWSPTGRVVALQAWDRVEVQLILHSPYEDTGIGLMFPGTSFSPDPIVGSVDRQR